MLDHNALVNIRSLSQLMKLTVEDVINANGHNSCQTPLDLNASRDLLPIAIALAEDQILDINVRDAQLVKFKIQTILKFATLQSVMDNTRSEDQLMPTHAENAKTANSQDIFQTTLELHVS